MVTAVLPNFESVHIDYSVNYSIINEQCFNYNNFFIYIDTDSIKQAQLNSPLLEIDNLLNNSVYTWIACNLGPQQINYYFVECISKNEITNKHTNIAKKIYDLFNSDFEIYCAGELYINNTEVIINSMSGTYVAPDPNDLLISIEQQKFFLNNLQNELHKNKYTDVTIDCSLKTLINDVTMLMDYDRLVKLLQLKVVIYAYNNLDDCRYKRDLKNNEIKINTRNKQAIDTFKKIKRFNKQAIPPNLKPLPSEPPPHGIYSLLTINNLHELSGETNKQI